MSFNPIELWGKMTIIAQGVVVVLIIMSIYSLTITVSKWWSLRRRHHRPHRHHCHCHRPRIGSRSTRRTMWSEPCR